MQVNPFFWYIDFTCNEIIIRGTDTPQPLFCKGIPYNGGIFMWKTGDPRNAFGASKSKAWQTKVWEIDIQMTLLCWRHIVSALGSIDWPFLYVLHIWRPKVKITSWYQCKGNMNTLPSQYTMYSTIKSFVTDKWVLISPTLQYNYYFVPYNPNWWMSKEQIIQRVVWLNKTFNRCSQCLHVIMHQDNNELYASLHHWCY